MPLALLPIVAEIVSPDRVTSSPTTLKLSGVNFNLPISSAVRELLPLYVWLIASVPLLSTVIVTGFFFNVIDGLPVDGTEALPLFV